MSPRRTLLVTATAAVFALAAGSVQAASLSSGRRLVQRNCAVCHSVGAQGESRHPGAPPFRDLHARYPMEMLEQALTEGMLKGHPEMPEFRFSPSEVDDIIAYLKSIQTRTAIDYSLPSRDGT